jgi:hypothetical protein
MQHPTTSRQVRASLLRYTPPLPSLCRGKMLEPAPEVVLAAAPSREDLDSCAHQQWEALQMYILDPATNGPKLPKVGAGMKSVQALSTDDPVHTRVCMTCQQLLMC